MEDHIIYTNFYCQTFTHLRRSIPRLHKESSTRVAIPQGSGSRGSKPRCWPRRHSQGSVERSRWLCLEMHVHSSPLWRRLTSAKLLWRWRFATCSLWKMVDRIAWRHTSYRNHQTLYRKGGPIHVLYLKNHGPHTLDTQQSLLDRSPLKYFPGHKVYWTHKTCLARQMLPLPRLNFPFTKSHWDTNSLNKMLIFVCIANLFGNLNPGSRLYPHPELFPSVWFYTLVPRRKQKRASPYSSRVNVILCLNLSRSNGNHLFLPR